MLKVMGVYSVDFKTNIGAEFSNRHYAVILTDLYENTCLVAPITSKKTGKKYRHGITIDTTKYQKNPTYKKAFVLLRKIREVDAQRIAPRKSYTLDSDDEIKLKNKLKEILDINI